MAEYGKKGRYLDSTKYISTAMVCVKDGYRMANVGLMSS